MFASTVCRHFHRSNAHAQLNVTRHKGRHGKCSALDNTVLPQPAENVLRTKPVG